YPLSLHDALPIYGQPHHEHTHAAEDRGERGTEDLADDDRVPGHRRDEQLGGVVVVAVVDEGDHPHRRHHEQHHHEHADEHELAQLEPEIPGHVVQQVPADHAHHHQRHHQAHHQRTRALQRHGDVPGGDGHHGVHLACEPGHRGLQSSGCHSCAHAVASCFAPPVSVRAASSWRRKST